MSIPHLIQLLPDTLANQIAAGEVVQRPASVVKELMENAVDAGATQIDLLIKDAGKALIQVSDNGSGMSARDARMAFERHATSKIRKVDDLFNIRTLGFRGEALASIAAVAQVRLRTRLQTEELGLEIDIEANEVKRQEAVACKPGSVFQVKNLFFNVPARRNFLKSTPVETRHVLSEFVRIALARPDLGFSFTHNETEVYNLPVSRLDERFIALAGDDLKGKLIFLEEETGYVRLSGFIARPDVHRKYRGEQYFFVNGRFIKSPYLHHAIANAYADFLPKETYPIYCIFLEIDPIHVDINIHPTKTEVKFDDEHTLYVLLQGMIKKGLATIHDAPSIPINPDPIESAIYQSRSHTWDSSGDETVGAWRKTPAPPQEKPSRQDWESLYQPPAPRQTPVPSWTPSHEPPLPKETPPWLVTFSPGYLLTRRGDRLFIIDQQRAHQRILFERFAHSIEGKPLSCQQLLFPQTLSVSAMDQVALAEADPVLRHLGFEVKDFGPGVVIVYGMPPELPGGKASEILKEILADMHQGGTGRAQEKAAESIARAIAMRSAVSHQQKLSQMEAEAIVEGLFLCKKPSTAPNGRPTFKTIDLGELEAYFR
jgi:DNA mismatch repair protein MutL